jgi:hypothetical protein
VLSRRDILFWAVGLSMGNDVRDEWFWGAKLGRTKRMVWLFGDSISRGYALGTFADLLPPADPLYHFRSIASMANLTLADNGRNERFAYAGGVISGNELDRAKTIAYNQSLLLEGIVRSGDLVVIEDAGDYPGTAIEYQAELDSVIEPFVTAGIETLLMTMFDYSSNPADQFDRIDESGLSRNDAIRAVALARGTRLVDMDSIMNQWRDAALYVDDVSVMRDPIHPNVWGQGKMAGVLLKEADLRQHLANANNATWLAQANYLTLGYGTASPHWDANRAGAYAQALLLA